VRLLCLADIWSSTRWPSCTDEIFFPLICVVLCGRSPKKGDGSTIIVYDLALVPAYLGRDLYCMCSGSARVWEQLCSPGESNSGLKVLPYHQATPYPTPLPAPHCLSWSAGQNCLQQHRVQFHQVPPFHTSSTCFYSWSADLKTQKSSAKNSLFGDFSPRMTDYVYKKQRQTLNEVLLLGLGICREQETTLLTVALSSAVIIFEF
jgi:hypothetical protein